MNITPDWLIVSRETMEKLRLFALEVLRWNGAINLISKQSVHDVWQRHIIDSAQIYQYINPVAPLLDLGSGAGFPGMIMAIMGAQSVTLVESDQRKAAFLRESARLLALDVRVIARRIESVNPQSAETVTARALASLTDLLPHANIHLRQLGRAVFHKGHGAAAEIKCAQQYWKFDCTQITSHTNPESLILIIKNIEKR